MAKIIADAREGELDVVLVHKLGAPGHAEFAIGTVDETGQVYLSPSVGGLGISEAYVAAETAARLETLRTRRALYTPIRPPISPAGRLVIVVDNGIATGASMIAALRAVRAKQPARLIAAVAPPQALTRMAQEADEVVCLEAPEDFYAVGQWFEDFSQVTDAEVVALLQQASLQPVPALLTGSRFCLSGADDRTLGPPHTWYAQISGRGLETGCSSGVSLPSAWGPPALPGQAAPSAHAARAACPAVTPAARVRTDTDRRSPPASRGSGRPARCSRW
jgi:predicted phosphoribosyltransferase